MKKQVRFIVVDDDVTNNLICEYNIRSFNNLAQINLFTQPELALKYLTECGLEEETILFLDLNMPTMSGWEFLEMFRQFYTENQPKISVYILTSAIENLEREVLDFPYLKGFLSKPLTQTYLESIFQQKE